MVKGFLDFNMLGLKVGLLFYQGAFSAEYWQVFRHLFFLLGYYHCYRGWLFKNGDSFYLEVDSSYLESNKGIKAFVGFFISGVCVIHKL